MQKITKILHRLTRADVLILLAVIAILLWQSVPRLLAVSEQQTPATPPRPLSGLGAVYGEAVEDNANK